MLVTYQQPTQKHRGYTLRLVADHVTVYRDDNPLQALFAAHNHWDGVNGWDRCRQWVDDQIA